MKNHSRWLAGAAALTAAATTGAHAQIVQITLVNNRVSGEGGGADSLNANLAGTGPDIVGLMGSEGGFRTSYRAGYTARLSFKAPERGVMSNKVSGRAFYGVFFPSGGGISGGGLSKSGNSAVIDDQGKSAKTVGLQSEYPVKGSLFIPIALTSANVNGGTLTDALLEIQADSYSDSVALTRVIYDKGDPDVTTAELMNEVTTDGMYTVIGTTDDGFYMPTDVPESSSLALLALGAGGLLAWRQRAKAA